MTLFLNLSNYFNEETGSSHFTTHNIRGRFFKIKCTTESCRYFERKANPGSRVTALGIKRDQKALGYAAEKKDSATFEKAQYNNWSTALEGKVAGLTIQTAAAGPLETARIKLRGETSMVNSDNSALIVLDGVPIEQRSVGTGSAASERITIKRC